MVPTYLAFTTSTVSQGMRGVAALFLFVLSGCLMWNPFGGKRLPTIDGPETPDLLHEVTGTLVISGLDTTNEDDQEIRELQFLFLPDLAPHRLRLPFTARGVSGPDHEGRLVCWRTVGDRSVLRVISMGEDSDRPVASWEPEGGRIGSSELSPEHGRIALLLHVPDSSDRLEIRKLESDELAASFLADRMTPPRWCSDSVHLLVGVMDNGSGGSPTQRYVVVDSESGISTVLSNLEAAEIIRNHVDSFGVWWGEPFAGSRRDVAMEGADDRVPGLMAFGAIARTSANRILYEGLPTTGTHQVLFASAVDPTAMYTIKIADPETGRFATIVPYFWRRRVRYVPEDLARFAKGLDARFARGPDSDY